MQNPQFPDSDAIRNAESHGLVFSDDKKTLLRCENKDIVEVVVPDGVTGIGMLSFGNAPEDNAFINCSRLRSITLPSSVTYIGWEAFRNCSCLTDILLPENVKTIDNFAFQNCSSLHNVIISDSVTSIRWSAFMSCTSLIEVTIPDSVNYIGRYAFQDCTNLEKIKLPNSIECINDETFCGCSHLTEVTIPDSVIAIESGAFRQCTSLVSLTIPDSVKRIWPGAFAGVQKIISNNEKFQVDDQGVVLGPSYPEYPDVKNIIHVPQTISGSYTIPEDVNYLGSTDGMGSAGFAGCKNLTNIIIPNSVWEIGYHAFARSGLTKVTIPASVDKIYEGAFENCTNLTEVDFSNLRHKIDCDNDAFAGCSNIQNVIAPTDEFCEVIGILKYSGIRDIVIPNGVTKIEAYTFSGFENLQSVTIPDTVSVLEAGAFEDCTNLTDITIPDSVTSIEYSAFACCSGLTKIVIPNGVTKIEDETFFNCTNLTDITISDSVIKISKSAFEGAGCEEQVKRDYSHLFDLDDDCTNRNTI